MKTVRISRNPQKNWENNAIQFSRLIAEMEASGAFTEELSETLCTEMDISMDDLSEIVDRAQKTWDEIKSQTILKS
jgi:hypothetical protein